MRFLKRLSIKTKLILIILGISSASIVTALGINLINEISDLRNELRTNTEINARLISEYCTAPLIFGYNNEAHKVLLKLKAIPDIQDAFVYDAANNLFASYHRSDSLWIDAPFSIESLRSGYKGDFLNIIQPVEYEGENCGTVYLRVSTRSLDEKILSGFLTLALIIFIALLISFFLARYFQGIISIPIKHLATVTSQVAETNDYSVRVHSKGSDEITDLYDRINEMFSVIQKRKEERDKALKKFELLNSVLEQKIEQRTAEIKDVNINLKLERDKAQNYLDVVNVIIMFRNMDNVVTMINKTGSDVLGYKEKEIIGKKWDKNFTPESNKKQEILFTGENAKKKQSTESYILTKSGEKRMIAWKNNLLFDDSGNPAGILSSGEDITEQRKRLGELRKLSAAIEQSQTSVLITDSRGKIEYVNPQFTTFTGYSLVECIGKDPSLFNSGMTPPEVYKDLWETINSSKVWRGDLQNRKKSGELYWENVAISPISDENKKITHFVAVMSDITSRKEAEDHLIHYSRFQSLLTEISSGFISQQINQIDANIESALSEITNFVEAYAGFVFHSLSDSKVYKLSHIYISGKNGIIDTPIRKIDTKYLQLISENLKKGDTYSITDLKNLESENQYLYNILANVGINSLIVAPMINEDKIIGFTGLTCHKKNRIWKKDEASLLKLAALVFTNAIQRKITEENLKNAKAVAETAAMAKSQFLATVSHEIRTPMNAIIGLSHLMFNTKLTEKQTDYLTKIDRSAHSLLGIINDVLDFSKIEAGKMNIENIPFDLSQVLETVTALNAQKAFNKGLEFIIDWGGSVPKKLIGDPLRVGQVLTNFCSNAIKFTAEGEILIHIEVKERSDNKIKLKFSVSDTGIGLKEEQMKNLFAPFQQADSTTTRKYGGTGLGLTISKRLAELMGGEAGVNSVYGTGSTFYFTGIFELQDSDKSAKSPENKLHNLKALVSDANKTSQALIAEILESFSADVKQVYPWKQALEILLSEENQSTDVVFLDPGADYTELIPDLVKIRKKRGKKNLKIMLLVPYGLTDINKEISSKVDAIITKPFSPSLLYDKLIEIYNKESLPKNHKRRGEDFTGQLQNIKGARILLVEDNEINQQVASELLENSGFIVDIANNGFEAVEILRNSESATHYSLVFMDLQMPVMDGISATQKIRDIKSLDKLPVVAMTADAIVGVKEKCIAAGMQDFITKPINPDKVFKSILKWIAAENIEREDQSQSPDIKKGYDQSTEEEETVIPDIEGITIENGLERVAGNKKLYKDLLIKFYNNNISFSENIIDAFNKYDNDPELPERLAHTLKGVSGNLGALSLFESAKNIELDFKENSGKNFNDLLADVNEHLRPVLDSIKNNLLSGGEIMIKKLPREKLLESLNDLKKLLEDYDTDASAKIKEIGIVEGFESELTKIQKCLDDYEYDEATTFVEEMIRKMQ